MKLTPLGANRNEVDLGNGLKVLFSYKTPVAYIDGDGITYVTKTKWSRTTSKHINQWATGFDRIEVPQEQIDNLVDKGGVQC